MRDFESRKEWGRRILREVGMCKEHTPSETWQSRLKLPPITVVLLNGILARHRP